MDERRKKCRVAANEVHSKYTKILSRILRTVILKQEFLQQSFFSVFYFFLYFFLAKWFTTYGDIQALKEAEITSLPNSFTYNSEVN